LPWQGSVEGKVRSNKVVLERTAGLGDMRLVEVLDRKLIVGHRRSGLVRTVGCHLVGFVREGLEDGKAACSPFSD
jgi:hypothetical protein